jgi:hypothetical protein
MRNKEQYLFEHPNIWIRIVFKSIVGGNQMPITIKSIIQSIFMIWNYNVRNLSSLSNVLKRYPILSSTWNFNMVRTLYNLCWSYPISSSFLMHQAKPICYMVGNILPSSMWLWVQFIIRLCTNQPTYTRGSQGKIGHFKWINKYIKAT